MEGRIAIGKLLDLHWRSWRGLLVSWSRSHTSWSWRERKELLVAELLKHPFPSLFHEGICTLWHSTEVYTYGSSLDTCLPLAPLFQGSRSRVRASVK